GVSCLLVCGHFGGKSVFFHHAVGIGLDESFKSGGFLIRVSQACCSDIGVVFRWIFDGLLLRGRGSALCGRGSSLCNCRCRYEYDGNEELLHSIAPWRCVLCFTENDAGKPTCGS